MEVDIQPSRSGEVKTILKITLMSLSIFKDVLSADSQVKHEGQVWPPTKGILHPVTSLIGKVQGPFWQGHKEGKEQSGAFQIRNETHLHWIWGQERKRLDLWGPEADQKDHRWAVLFLLAKAPKAGHTTKPRG